MSVKYKGEVGDVVCLECDKPTDIELFAKKHTFEYGGEHTGVKAIEMSCIIPIHRCCSCGFMWLDMSAEVIIDYTVQKILKEGRKANGKNKRNT